MFRHLSFVIWHCLEFSQGDCHAPFRCSQRQKSKVLAMTSGASSLGTRPLYHRESVTPHVIASSVATKQSQWGETKKSEVKNQNDKPKRKNVVRGFSLARGQDCTTLKGRTTIAFGIWSLRFFASTNEFWRRKLEVTPSSAERHYRPGIPYARRH